MATFSRSSVRFGALVAFVYCARTDNRCFSLRGLRANRRRRVHRHQPRLRWLRRRHCHRSQLHQPMGHLGQQHMVDLRGGHRLRLRRPDNARNFIQGHRAFGGECHRQRLSLRRSHYRRHNRNDSSQPYQGCVHLSLLSTAPSPAGTRSSAPPTPSARSSSITAPPAHLIRASPSSTRPPPALSSQPTLVPAT